MSKAIEHMCDHQSVTKSKWRENAQWRRDNERWLKYSRLITLKIMRAMDEQSITQAVLAERMGCTQQYVSNILKGNSNMTLETISRIEDALNIDIMQTSMQIIDGYTNTNVYKSRHLTDSEHVPYGIEH